jgi:hypothetical protein
MSATMSGVNDVKDAVKIAKNELKSFKRRTILFMDEIHRFNKLQQVLMYILVVIFFGQFLGLLSLLAMYEKAFPYVRFSYIVTSVYGTCSFKYSGANIIISHNPASILIHQGVTYTVVHQVSIWEVIKTHPMYNYSEVQFFVFELHAACL